MGDLYKYLFIFIVSIVLLGIMTTICIVDYSITFLIFAIVALLTTVGSLILYLQERKEAGYMNRKRKSGKRFK